MRSHRLQDLQARALIPRRWINRGNRDHKTYLEQNKSWSHTPPLSFSSTGGFATQLRQVSARTNVMDISLVRRSRQLGFSSRVGESDARATEPRLWWSSMSTRADDGQSLFHSSLPVGTSSACQRTTALLGFVSMSCQWRSSSPRAYMKGPRTVFPRRL